MASFVVAFEGDFFFRPRVTWVHPSSPLLGSFPISFVGLVLAAAIVVVVVVVGGGDVGSGDVGGGDVGLLLFFTSRTSRNAPAVYRTSIEVFDLRRSPSLYGFHIPAYEVWPENPSY